MMLSPAIIAAAAVVDDGIDTSAEIFKIGIGEAFLFALVGFAIVFAVLLAINGFIRLLSVIVRAVENAAANKTAAPAPAAAAPAAAPAASAAPAIPAGMKPADGSLGDIKLYDVDDATAAMIMAIVADKLEAPLNELRFKSIKEVKK